MDSPERNPVQTAYGLLMAELSLCHYKLAMHRALAQAAIPGSLLATLAMAYGLGIGSDRLLRWAFVAAAASCAVHLRSRWLIWRTCKRMTLLTQRLEALHAELRRLKMISLYP